MLTKALTAAWKEKGANPGTQAEFGEALFLLEAYGFDSVSLLDDLASATAAASKMPLLEGVVEVADLAHHAAPVFDHVMAEMRPVEILLSENANALVMAGFAASYGAVVPGIATFYLGEEREVIAPYDYILERENLDHVAAFGSPVKVVVEPGGIADPLRVKAEGSVEIDDNRWQRLAGLAAKLLVPASDESRARGAGAGLNDND